MWYTRHPIHKNQWSERVIRMLKDGGFRARHSMMRGLWLLVLVSLAALPVMARPPLPVAPVAAFRPVATLGGEAEYRALAVAGTLAVAGAEDWLRVFDVAEPRSPRLQGSLQLPGAIYDLRLRDGLAYVAVGRAFFGETGEPGLAVVSLREPTRPTLLRFAAFASTAYTIELNGATALVGTFPDGILAFDLADPVSPTLQSTLFVSGFAQDMTVANGRLYLASTDGLNILSLADPLSPTLEGTFVSQRAYAVAVRGTTAFLTSNEHGFAVIDVTEPRTPTLRGQYVARLNTPPTFGLQIVGNLAFVAGFFDQQSSLGRLDVLDLRSTTRPVRIASMPIAGRPYRIRTQGDTLFMSTALRGLQAANIAIPTAPQVIGRYDLPNDVRRIVVRGEQAFVASGDEGLYVLDIKSPITPIVVANYRPIDPLTQVQSVAVAQNRAYLPTSRSGMQIVDLTLPFSPTLLGTYAENGRDVVISDTLAYLAIENFALDVVDVSDAAMPQGLGRVPLPRRGERVVAQDGIVFASNERGMFVVDARDPGLPRLQIDYDIGLPAQGVAVVSGTVYLANQYGLDLLAPPITTTLTARGYFNLLKRPPDSFAVAIADGRAYLATNDQGVFLLDVRNPAQPTLLTSYPGEFDDVAVKNRRVFLASGGVTVLAADGPYQLFFPFVRR